ncbi:MAG TPA: J domain-containing protein [Anaeromyxobacteraceae bacterium]|nr:J domain-containing protein [Anaeromyxobacteraceae bacterium]
MRPENQRAIVARRALARTAPDRPDPVADAERRLAEALAEVTRLDLEVETLSLSLGEFGRAYEVRLAAVFAELELGERLVRRLQALEDEVGRIGEAMARPGRSPAKARRPAAWRRPRRRRRGADEGAPDEAQAPEAVATEPEAGGLEVEPEEVVLKRLFRRLARVLHPDLAQDDAERRRLGDLMAKVNAAYADGDRTALELMAEKLGAGEPLSDLSEAERLAHLENRAAGLERIAASLRREKSRLEGSHTFRLREEARRRGEARRDYFEETRAEVEAGAEHAFADALARLERLVRAARDLERRRREAMSEPTRRSGPTGALRAFDPLSESALVRKGALHLERQRATPEARELGRLLEELVAEAPWQAALTLMAFFAEAAGRPPDSLSSPGGWAERYQALREEAGWPEAPPFERLVARLPRHLEVGMRATPGAVEAGVQLTRPELGAGVRIALEREAVAGVAREVLSRLGPAERCRRCRRTVQALHLLRTRGLDELNGLACPDCGAVLRSYWRYGELEGLEALAPFALELGLVAEQVVRLAGAAVGFQMLPEERRRLTAARLRERFHEIYCRPYEVGLAPGDLSFATAAGPLAPQARLPERGAVRLVLAPKAGMSEAALLELLRGRIERRFRPERGGEA